MSASPAHSGAARRILVVEDDPDYAFLIRREFERRPEAPEVTFTGSLSEARESIAGAKPDAIISDLYLPDGRGTELLSLTADLCPVIILTSHGDERVAVESMRAGAADYYAKSSPTITVLPETVLRVVREWRVTTELRRLQHALAASAREMQETLDALPDMVFRVDAHGHISFANEAVRRHGYQPEALKGVALVGLFHPLDRDRASAVLDGKGGDAGDLRLCRNTPDVRCCAPADWAPAFVGVWVDMEVVRHAEGCGRLCILRDVTERRRMERELRLSEATYRAVFDGANDAIFLHDLETGEILDANARMTDLFGYTLEDLLRSSLTSLCTDIEPHRARDAYEWIARTVNEGPQTVEWLSCRKDGSTFWAEVSLKVVPVEGEPHVLAVVRDITERKEAEAALRKSEAKYRILFDSAADLIAVVDRQGDFLDLNRRFEEESQYSRDEMLGRNVFTSGIVTPESVERLLVLLRAILDGADDPPLEIEGVRKDGQRVPFELRAVPIIDDGRIVAVQAILRNLTERKRLEEQQKQLEERMVQAHKLQSLGAMAGGIAHDFNNLLMAILGYADLALMEVTDDTAPHGYLREVIRSARRAAELSSHMLAYSGRGKMTPTTVNLSELIAEMRPLLSSAAGDAARIKYYLDANLPAINADPNQIRQVLMAVVTNAAEAMGTRGGVVYVSTGSIEATSELLSGTYVDDGLKGGRYAYLKVMDTGCGMDSESLTRLFDPFFTTKFPGRGLGMATVLGVIRAHKGAVNVDSAPGEGTTVKLLLPVT